MKGIRLSAVTAGVVLSVGGLAIAPVDGAAHAQSASGVCFRHLGAGHHYTVVAYPCLLGESGYVRPQRNALDDHLAALWTTVLETPSAQNAFGTGGAAFACWDLGGTVAPLGPGGVESCTVKPGTRLLVAGFTVECSTFEGNGTTEAELRACARDSDAQAPPTVTLDGSPVSLREVETPLLDIVLPADNIFGLPAGTAGLSVGHGWLALLHPLTPGTHTIVIDSTITTTIVVNPGG